jgi:broad specificity phosphatase PhoE
VQIVLVRHGATDWNLQGRCQGSTDRDLSDVGIRQAEQLAVLLSNEKIHAIYSSNLRRARQTAELISQPLNLSVMIEDDVRELDHGELEGLTFNEIKSAHAEFLARWRSIPAEICVPGGERLAAVAERAWNGLTQIVRRHQVTENIVVVSHNFPILGIICRVTATHLNDYRAFHVDPCSLTRLRYDGNGDWQVTQVNSRDYPAQNPTPL